MNNFTNLYEIPRSQLNSQMLERLNELSSLHFEKCTSYRSIVSQLFKSKPPFLDIAEIPFLPVRLFKELSLSSVDPSLEYKVMYSSGTSGTGRSKIILDRVTARFQSEVLSKIFQFEFGSRRLPMLVIDSDRVIKERDGFSARTAAVVGFSTFASRKHFALKSDMSIDFDCLKEFAEQYNKQEVILFGFTHVMWQAFSNYPLKDWGSNFSEVKVLHGGGWKKLQNLQITTQDFKKTIREATNAIKIVDYYGMVEQAGSIFMECPSGYFHTTPYSEILIRDPFNFKIQNIGSEGLIQLFSTLPTSYPGHSILTEDLGVVLGEDSCDCGRSGRFFKVLGRMPKAEIRGCSDV